MQPGQPSRRFGGLGLGRRRRSRTAKGELGQEEFLKLMITQLKNQDPFKPMESGEFLGQLAQFGTVSGLPGCRRRSTRCRRSLVSNQALQAASLVGRSALVESLDRCPIGAGQPVAGAVELPAARPRSHVTIRDASGQIGAHDASSARSRRASCASRGTASTTTARRRRPAATRSKRPYRVGTRSGRGRHAGARARSTASCSAPTASRVELRGVGESAVHRGPRDSQRSQSTPADGRLAPTNSIPQGD